MKKLVVALAGFGAVLFTAGSLLAADKPITAAGQTAPAADTKAGTQVKPGTVNQTETKKPGTATDVKKDDSGNKPVASSQTAAPSTPKATVAKEAHKKATKRKRHRRHHVRHHRRHHWRHHARHYRYCMPSRRHHRHAYIHHRSHHHRHRIRHHHKAHHAKVTPKKVHVTPKKVHVTPKKVGQGKAPQAGAASANTKTMPDHTQGTPAPAPVKPGAVK